MSKLQQFKDFVNERLAAAALEIFWRFENTLAECEEEICRSEEKIVQLQKKLDIQPKIKLPRIVLQQLPLPEPPEIKEEQVLCTIQGGEQFQGLQSHTTHSIFTSPRGKTHCDQKASSQFPPLDQTPVAENRERDSLYTNTTKEQVKAESVGEDDRTPEPANDFQLLLNPDSPISSHWLSPEAGLSPSPWTKPIDTDSMPGVRVKISKKGQFRPEDMEKAVNSVLEGLSVRASAAKHGVGHVTLSRYVKRIKAANGDHESVRKPGFHRPHGRVFTRKQEEILAGYLVRAADIYGGLSPKEVCRLAYQLAIKHNCQFPESWKKKEVAGNHWFNSFINRNPSLSLQKPQRITLTRTSSFNRYKVTDFFQNLESIFGRHKLEAHQVWSMDETNALMVQVPDKVTKGRKQVGALTPAKKTTLVTLAMAINGQGNSIPPQFIFPRKKFEDHFIRDGPRGCVGTANGSGWMHEPDFLVFLQHFMKHSRASLEFPQLLILDNHFSHLSLEGIDLCRANGVILLTLPPHCSHRLQPLDRTVFGPLKHHINLTMDWWIKSNPRKTLSIYDLPGIAAKALPLAATPSKIIAGFRCTGIWPYNPFIYTDMPDTPAVGSSPSPPSSPEPLAEAWVPPSAQEPAAAAAQGSLGSASQVEEIEMEV